MLHGTSCYLRVIQFHFSAPLLLCNPAGQGHDWRRAVWSCFWYCTAGLAEFPVFSPTNRQVQVGRLGRPGQEEAPLLAAAHVLFPLAAVRALQLFSCMKCRARNLEQEI